MPRRRLPGRRELPAGARRGLPSASTSSAFRWAVGSGLPERLGTWRRSVVVTLSRLLTRGPADVTDAGAGPVGVPAAEPSTVRSKAAGGCSHGFSSKLDLARAGHGRHAGLDADAVPGRSSGEVAVAQVAHRAPAQRDDTAEADAHATPGRHEDAGALAGVEDRGRAVGVQRRAGSGESRAGLPRPARRPGAGSARCVEALWHAGLAPVGLEVVQQAGRAAGPPRSRARASRGRGPPGLLW